jgi:hypothetical protein
MVKIHRVDVKWDTTVKTDKRGHYIHTGVPLGTFEITVTVDGKEVDKLSCGNRLTQPIPPRRRSCRRPWRPGRFRMS